MEINDLHIEKYIKVANLSHLARPDIFSSLCIFDKRDYFRHIQCFDVTDNTSHRYQLYISTVPPRQNVLEKIIFVKEAPKFLFLKGEAESIVLEERVQDRLSDYLIYYESKESPYLPQAEARNIVMDVMDSTLDYMKHIPYDCISPKNIMRMDEKWYLSGLALIFGLDKDLPEYNTTNSDQEKQVVFSWACLLFKLVFGFTPFPQSTTKRNKEFKFREYLGELEKSDQNIKMLKIYNYGFRVLQISPSCLELLEQALSCNLTIRQWKQHPYFASGFHHESPLTQKNKQLKMVNAVEPSKYSLMMASIEFRKKYPLEKLNAKSRPSPDDLSNFQIVESYRKNYLLKHLTFAPGFEKKQLISGEDASSIIPTLSHDYFYEEAFDAEQDFPCRDLLKIIQREKQDRPDLYRDSKREAEVKLYAYPYAVAFELCKVQTEQPIQIRRKITKTIELLLELSALNYPGNIKPLHNTVPQVKDFLQMKTVYREHINELYKYFLNQAMRKYNSKKQTSSIIDRMKRKEKGLEYYRLCLKLLEASLIVRKGGKQLDLARIETSQRKEIQHDLEELLKNYFPNKAEIH